MEKSTVTSTEAAVFHALILWPAPFWQIESAEQFIDPRKVDGKIHIDRFLFKPVENSSFRHNSPSSCGYDYRGPISLVYDPDAERRRLFQFRPGPRSGHNKIGFRAD